MSKNDDYVGVLLEEMNSKFDLLVEGQAQILEILDQKADKSELAEIKDDLRLIKAIVTDGSKQVRDHEQQITKLEASRA